MATTLAELAAFAAPLTAHQNISLTAGQSWHYQPQSRVITVNQHDLLWRPKTWLLAVLLHEIGHVLISRYTCFQPTEPAYPWRPLLANVLEDIRVNRYVSQRYPGAANWISALYQQETDSPPPQLLCQQFISALFHKYYQPHALLSLSTDVQQSIAALAAPLMHLYQALPDEVSNNTQAHCMQQIWPALSPYWQQQLQLTLAEQTVLQAAWQAWHIQRQTIEPAFVALIAQDAARFARLLAIDTENFDKITLLSNNSDPRCWQLLAKQLLALEPFLLEPTYERSQPTPTAKHQQQATRLVLALLAQYQPSPTALEAHASNTPTTSYSRPLNPQYLAPDVMQYQKIATAQHGAIVLLSQQLTQVLPQTFRAQPIRRAANSGRTLHMAGVMQHCASNGSRTAIWRQPIQVRQPATAVTLLIDCSASMWPEKIETAITGAVVLCEALKRSQLPFAVNGFQDKLIAVKPLSLGMPPQAMVKLLALKDECSGTAPNGNNQNGCNDDGPCLQTAANSLLQSDAAHKLCIVIGDGEVNGKHSTGNDLTKAVTALSQLPNFSLIALGIGPDTATIKQHYPNSEAEIAPEQFVAVLSKVLVRAVT